ncbi:MAG: SAM-dependent methyltransferase [Planctomycetota bacterium]
MSELSLLVHEGCALEWLADNKLPSDSAVLTSLPSYDEFGHRDADRWRDWFVDAARTVLETSAHARATVFFQTDVEHEGTWLDKSFLIQQAALAVAAPLVWHKLVLRAPIGTTCVQRPGYAHLLCFSQTVRRSEANAAPDVLPTLGKQLWPRGMGQDVAAFVVSWLRQHAGAGTLVAPFCGVGTALHAARSQGLHAIGIERNPGRAARARKPVTPPA